jgi:HicA toxin of bacterial toxin-antitoxin,
MQKKIPSGTVTVPVPDHAEIRIGTLQSIIRQSGVARSEFEEEWFRDMMGQNRMSLSND